MYLSPLPGRITANAYCYKQSESKTKAKRKQSEGLIMKKYCKFCGSYLGDTKTCIDNEGNEINYFSIIAKKYCDEHAKLAREQSNTVNLHNYRQRQKMIRKAEKTKLELIEEENKLLRMRNMQLRVQVYGSKD